MRLKIKLYPREHKGTEVPRDKFPVILQSQDGDFVIMFLSQKRGLVLKRRDSGWLYSVGEIFNGFRAADDKIDGGKFNGEYYWKPWKGKVVISV